MSSAPRTVPRDPAGRAKSTSGKLKSVQILLKKLIETTLSRREDRNQARSAQDLFEENV